MVYYLELKGEKLPYYYEEMIDDAISEDFLTQSLTPTDYESEIYKFMELSLEFSDANIIYCKKVISKQHSYPIIPNIQYLFCFKPIDGICLLAKDKKHKEILCNGDLFNISRFSTSPIHSLMYLLISSSHESDEFNIWSYVPVDKNNEDTSEKGNVSLQLRRKLFSN